MGVLTAAWSHGELNFVRGRQAEAVKRLMRLFNEIIETNKKLKEVILSEGTSNEKGEIATVELASREWLKALFASKDFSVSEYIRSSYILLYLNHRKTLSNYRRLVLLFDFLLWGKYQGQKVEANKLRKDFKSAMGRNAKKGPTEFLFKKSMYYSETEEVFVVPEKFEMNHGYHGMSKFQDDFRIMMELSGIYVPGGMRSSEDIKLEKIANKTMKALLKKQLKKQKKSCQASMAG